MFQRYFNKTFTYDPNKGEDQTYSFYRYPVNWVVFSWFIGFGLVVFFLFRTMITIDATFHYFLLFGGIATAIHYFLTKHRSIKILPVMTFYNLFGVAALVCGLFLTLNYAFKTSTVTKRVPIQEIHKNPNFGKKMDKSEVKLGSSIMEEFKYFINFNQWDYQEFRKAKALQITLSKGLFGYQIYEGAELLNE